MRLDFDDESDTWAVATPNGETYPFTTMIDENHVKMITPEGDFRMVELSESGIMAYAEATKASSTLAI